MGDDLLYELIRVVHLAWHLRNDRAEIAKLRAEVEQLIDETRAALADLGRLEQTVASIREAVRAANRGDTSAAVALLNSVIKEDA